MPTTWLLSAAALLGAAVTALVAVLLYASYRTSERARTLQEEIPPDGVIEAMAALPFPAFIVDPSKEVVYRTGPLDQLGLLRDARIVHPAVIDIVGRVRDSRLPVSQELVIGEDGGDAAEVDLTVHASVLGARYILVVIEDRTRGVRVDRMRRDFTANVSHELKTPIAAIMLLCEAVVEAADDPEQVRRFARQMHHETSRLGDLVHDIITLSHIESETDYLSNSDRVDMRDVVETAIENSRVFADNKDVRLTLKAKGELDVRGREDMLVTAVQNLVTNAIEYSPEHVSVGIAAQRIGDTVRVIVTDQGRGIAPEHQKRVFERFFRVDSSRSSGGTGLGLSIVKHVAQGHGGSVALWSRPGIGSSFTLSLPSWESTRDRGVSRPEPDPARQRRTAPATGPVPLPRGLGARGSRRRPAPAHPHEASSHRPDSIIMNASEGREHS